MGIIGDKLTKELAEAVARVEMHSAQVAAGLAEFHNGVRLRGARPLTIGTHPRLSTAHGRLVGWSVYAEGGPVKVRVWDGREAGAGDVVAAFSLAADEASTEWLGAGGVSFGEGLWLDVSGAGQLVGTVYTGAVD